MKDIFVVLNSKGGVAKSTTAQQFITPFLYTKINNEKDKTSKKVKLFEVDSKNDSAGVFKNTKIFDSILIKDSINELKEIIRNELNDLKRNYPIVIDVGVGYFEDTVNTLSKLYFYDKVHFIVPTRKCIDDYNNSLATIHRLKESFKDANFILFLSEARSGFSKEENSEIRKEFKTIFKKFNVEIGKFNNSLFEDAEIDIKYLSLKADDSIDDCKTDFGLTMYETKDIDLYPLTERIPEIRELAKNDKLSEKEFDELQKELNILSFKLEFFSYTQNYVNKHIQPLFREFETLLR